jgi:peptidoglycan L-alanyl-D-glutamate endopeptidase CwlK
MPFTLGAKSLQELDGVHPELVKVVKRAIELTEQDFSVNDGKRTIEEQRHYLESGATTTMDSRHLTGHAVDLVPYINGKLRWEWGPIYKITAAMQNSAAELNIPIRWGGVWDRELAQLHDFEQDVAAYVSRRKAIGKKAFLDGPHYELPKQKYP